jgi:hypothetical protein
MYGQRRRLSKNIGSRSRQTLDRPYLNSSLLRDWLQQDAIKFVRSTAMKNSFLRLFGLLPLLVFACPGCSVDDDTDVVDLNKVLDSLVAVLDEGAKKGDAPPADLAGADQVNITASSSGGEISSTAEIEAIEPSKQNPILENEFLTKYAAKLNEVKAMNSTVGVSINQGGEIIGFKDLDANGIQDLDDTKEFTVTIDPANHRLVASDNNGYHRPHSYGFNPGGMMMGYMLGSMMGRQGSFYSGPMSSAKPNFANTPMSDKGYHKSAVSSVRSRVSSSGSSGARARTGSKGFSFGK